MGRLNWVCPGHRTMGKYGRPMGKWWHTERMIGKMMNKWWAKVHVSLGKIWQNDDELYGIWPKYQGFNHQEWGFNRLAMDMGLTKNWRYPKIAVFSWRKLPTIGLQGYPMFRPMTRILSIHAETEWWGMVSDNFGGPWSAQSQNQFDTGGTRDLVKLPAALMKWVFCLGGLTPQKLTCL